MRKKIILCFILMFSCATASFAAKGTRKFKTYTGSDYLTLGVGANYMFADVGGLKKDIHLGISDLNFIGVRPTLFAGYQHDWTSWLGNRILVSYSWLAGSDAGKRNHRVFEYTGTAAEAALHFVVYPYRHSVFDIYLYFGISGIYNHTFWRYLNPLTGDLARDAAGNPLPGRPGYGGGIDADSNPEDTRFNKDKNAFEHSAGVFALPFGVGFRFPVTDKISLGADIGARYPLGKNADFFDGIYTPWSTMKDIYGTVSFMFTYKLFGADDCYAKYGKGQYRSLNKRRR